jgi:COP9 signalosome complex subunit 7
MRLNFLHLVYMMIIKVKIKIKLENKDKYPDLSSKHLYKLKQLSIINMTQKESVNLINYFKLLTYKHLLKSLDIENIRELEDLLIDGMYRGLFQGKLDQKNSYVEIFQTMGRDIGEKDIDEMIKTLSDWYNFFKKRSNKSKKILKSLENYSDIANDTYSKNQKEEEENKKKIEDLKKNKLPEEVNVNQKKKKN